MNKRYIWLSALIASLLLSIGIPFIPGNSPVKADNAPGGAGTFCDGSLSDLVFVVKNQASLLSSGSAWGTSACWLFAGGVTEDLSHFALDSSAGIPPAGGPAQFQPDGFGLEQWFQHAANASMDINLSPETILGIQVPNGFNISWQGGGISGRLSGAQDIHITLPISGSDFILITGAQFVVTSVTLNAPSPTSTPTATGTPATATPTATANPIYTSRSCGWVQDCNFAGLAQAKAIGGTNWWQPCTIGVWIRSSNYCAPNTPQQTTDVSQVSSNWWDELMLGGSSATGQNLAGEGMPALQIGQSVCFSATVTAPNTGNNVFGVMFSAGPVGLLQINTNGAYYPALTAGVPTVVNHCFGSVSDSYVLWGQVNNPSGQDTIISPTVWIQGGASTPTVGPTPLPTDTPANTPSATPNPSDTPTATPISFDGTPFAGGTPSPTPNNWTTGANTTSSCPGLSFPIPQTPPSNLFPSSVSNLFLIGGFIQGIANLVGGLWSMTVDLFVPQHVNCDLSPLATTVAGHFVVPDVRTALSVANVGTTCGYFGVTNMAVPIATTTPFSVGVDGCSAPYNTMFPDIRGLIDIISWIMFGVSIYKFGSSFFSGGGA